MAKWKIIEDNKSKKQDGGKATEVRTMARSAVKAAATPNNLTIKTPFGNVTQADVAKAKALADGEAAYQLIMLDRFYKPNLKSEAIVQDNTKVNIPIKEGVKIIPNEQKEKAIENYNEAYKWTSDYMNSPMYKKMLMESSANTGEFNDINNARWSNFKSIPPLQILPQPADHPNRGGQSSTFNGQIQLFPMGFETKGSNSHEISHSTDRPSFFKGFFNRAIPQSDKNYIEQSAPTTFKSSPIYNNSKSYYNSLEKNDPKEYKKKVDFNINYVSKDTETRARLNAIRQVAQQNNLYDPFKEGVTPELYYNKLKNFKFEKGDESGFDPLWQLKNVYSDEEIIYMLNHISENKKENDGTELNNLPIAQNGLLTKIKSTLNPLNIGVPDYTDKYKTWNEAYSAAKKAGLSEIMWNKGPNPGRKNLDYAGTPAQEMKSYGITGEQRVFNPSTARKNLGRLDTEKGYDTELSQVFKQLFDSKNPAVVNNEEPAYGIEKDAFRLYLGLPQEMNSFTPSKYQKGAFEIVNYNQMLPEVLDENIENLIKTKGNPEKEFKYGEHITGGNSPIKPYGDIVMGKHTVKKGKDDKGEYIEYADKWDLDSYKVGNVAVGQIADMVNKPLPIYGRVYYKDYGDGVKRKMYYSDNELKSFSTDKNNKNFNALDLQKELVNRGYELPNSMQQDDYGNINFDGIYGNETKQALQDFQSKKTPAPKMAVSLPGQSTALPPELKHGGKVSGWQIIDDIPKAEKGLAVGERKILQRPTQPVQEKSVIKSIPTTVKPQYKSEGDYLNQVYGEDSGVQLPGQSSILRASQDAKPAYDVAKQYYSSYNKEIQEQKTDEQVAKFLKANPSPGGLMDKVNYIKNLSPADRQIIENSNVDKEDYEGAKREYLKNLTATAVNNPLSKDFWNYENINQKAQGIGANLYVDKLGRVNDLLNVPAMIGDMAPGVVNIPYNLSKGNYGEAAMGLAGPLALAALTPGAKGFSGMANNLLNPLAGIVDANTVKGLGNKVLNNYGREAFTPMLDNVGVEAFGVGKQNIGSSVEGVENNLVTQLRKELEEKGIIGSQKTINFPWKEPIRKGVEPWVYGDMTLPDDAITGSNISTITGSKFKDVIGSIIGGKNPRYLSDKEYLMKYGNYDVKLKAKNLSIKEGENPIYDEDMQEFLKEKPALLNEKNIKDAINLRDKNRLTGNDMTGKNRYATWDMYLGKPQTQHPMYDISELTKSKKDIIYTIKEDFINKPEIQTKLKGFIESMERDLPGKEWTKKGDSWIIPDDDKGLFGTMGGFHWKVDKLNNGNYKIIANDVWDLQPLKTTGIPFIKNIEVGKALGIGKPMNVKVGFEIDGNTKKIIKTFNLGGAVLGASALQQKKHGGIIEDLRGQWAHPGSVTRIPSNQITMQGVNYPVLGVSDRGHTQMMYPGEDYSFRGKSVTEYPMMAGGGEVNFTYAGENHRVYEKESPTGNGKGIEGHIMVNHPTEDKGKWDTIDLTKITNGKVKTVAQGVASTKKWHKENPEYATGGNVSNWEILEDLPKAQNGTMTDPLSVPVTDNTKAPSLSALEYQTKIKEGYLPFLEKNKYVSKPYVDKTISTEKGNMNCIHGVCDVISETTGKTWDSPIKTYIGNPTFLDNEEKEGYYKVNNLQETGFVIGDVLQYARKKGSIGSRFPGEVTPKNKNELYPNHAVLIVDKGVNEKGETYYTVLNNRGETKWKDLKKSEVTEKELMSRAIKGYETYDGMLVNRYDPEYTQKQKEEKEKELFILKGNNENAKYYTGNKTFNYEEENIDPVLNTKSKVKNKKVQNLVDIYNKNYNTIGKSSDLEPFILDELIKKQIGIASQETKIGEDLGIKQYVPDSLVPTLRKFSSDGDDWVEDYWRSNAFKVQEEYKTKEDFIAKLNKNKVLDKETQNWIKNHSPRSQGTFQQKELSTRGRYFDLDLSKKEDQALASLNLAIDNYHLLSKKMPNLSPTELIDLTTLMHNAPSKALTPEFVNKYLQENNIDYVNKVNAFEKNGSFSSKEKLLKQKLKKKEVEDIQKMFSKQNGGKTKKSNWQIIEY